jgi:hemerythrin-like domain-containing protein
MALPRDTFQADVRNHITQGWRDFIHSMEESLNMLEKDLDDAAEMSEKCTGEWCEATEHVIDELSNSLFSISEPRWSSEEDSKKLKALKRRIHDLYAKYKVIAR